MKYRSRITPMMYHMFLKGVGLDDVILYRMVCIPNMELLVQMHSFSNVLALSV